MTHYYWHAICPLCKQGRLLIFKNLTHDKLYLHCEECEWGWNDPETADQQEAAFLTLSEEFEATPATSADVTRFAWKEYATHEFED